MTSDAMRRFLRDTDPAVVAALRSAFRGRERADGDRERVDDYVADRTKPARQAVDSRDDVQ